MRRLSLTLLAAGLLASGIASAATTMIPAAAVKTAEQLRDRALHDNTAYQVTASLTTEVGARLAGSEADRRAVDWAVAKFKELGYDKVYTEPVTYPLWMRRSEHAAIVAPFPQPLTLTALGYSPATPKGGLSAEVVKFDSLDALKAAEPASVKGKIVYVDYRMERAKDGHGYGMGSAVRVAGPVLAAEKGAAGYLLRSAGTDAHERAPHTGVTGFRDPAKAIPAAALANPDADQLTRVLAYGKPVTLKLDLDCGVVGEYTGANVIGEITGRRHPEQVVAIGGHLDSWDLGTGAIDDGAGVAIAMAAGKLIRDLPQRPDRTIRVIAFANEEMGLWGGRAYADKHAGEVAKFQLGTESDFGAGPIWRMSASVKPEARDAIGQIARVLEPVGVAYDATRPGGGGSDLSQMHAKGMAALSLTQDGTKYFDWHHTPNDTLDKIDPAELAQNVAVYAAFSYMAAQAHGDFGSAPGAFAKDGAGE
ncbi:MULTISPECIES: M20/M25/M40 family metallo-hydrolase [Rhodanobacter]|uniref:M20/M25/M40 family metallo-hydrolase n=1 Tax=Rhodanobacter TaxID=75309 RepID=UPI000418F13A|nr:MULTISPECIES: M20/M25/M40 family metallo-hydrolase [Rhodanobacter]KZC19215.1 aminopeptidase [Rhodanobacter denitrificans]UJJ50487.1 M20/M25/M40 family metallo-hydrolase [Rhodanobacter denitrificans]UJM93202.1 M20/M25/M40 family metallo-hydrolase [Rhodanobacter denitrificans]UJM96734.1 M20/M25/M40 family metallo-hydrolase [Rhodanobacter denitrificans]UJN20437.1 M20/M25/M40 family metallo-hydrolase [Rhodanobacter denitrificans]